MLDQGFSAIELRIVEGAADLFQRHSKMTAEDRKPIAVATSRFDERQGQFSPNGRRVAYETDESGRFEIVAQAFPNAGAKFVASLNGGIQPRWSADCKELYFLGPDSKLMSVPVNEAGSTLEFGKPIALFPAPVPTGGPSMYRPMYAVSRDGRFLLNLPLAQASATPITLVLNWTPAENK